MPQSTNVLTFISPHSGEVAPRKGSPGSHGHLQDSGADDALRRIAEAALSATSAEGAALALEQPETQETGIVVCVARAGEMAPPIGAKLDGRTGISGECLRSGQALHCEDTETDERVDRQACRALGLRSLAIAPVKRGNQVVGILEVFSARPDAFNLRHLDVLRQLTELVLDDFETNKSSDPAESESGSLEPERGPGRGPSPTLVPPAAPYAALTPVEDETTPLPLPQPAALASAPMGSYTPATPTPNEVNIAAYLAAEEEAHAQSKMRTPFVVLIGLAALLLFAGLSTLVWRRMALQSQQAATGQAVQTAAVSGTVAPTSGVPATSPAVVTKPDAGTPQNFGASPTQINDARSSTPLLTKAAAREVVRRDANLAGDTVNDVTQPIRVVNPGSNNTGDSDIAPPLDVHDQSGQALASMLSVPPVLPGRALPISQGVQGGELERRVEPVYPAQARVARQQGNVVLQAFVTESGLVRDVRIVSGPPLLGQAAAQAVRQWKYKPFQLNGKPVAMETQVKVTFKLP